MVTTRRGRRLALWLGVVLGVLGWLVLWSVDWTR